MKEIYPFKECEQYVELLQRNIDRMAGNSSSFKNWLVATVGGSLAICFTKEVPSDKIESLIIVLIVITILFYILDSFYLGIERRMKNAEKLFIEKCKENNESDVKLLLMSFSPTLVIREKSPDSCAELGYGITMKVRNTIKAMGSFSTLLFYPPIIIILLVLNYYLL